MSQRVTIKTLASDLGISHITVSRALTNNPNVRKETREKIQKRAAELGYVKSAAATAIRGDGTRIVGLLVPNLVNEFYARFANSLALLCEDNDLHLITHITNDDPIREQLTLKKLRELQASAVILVPAPSSQMHDERLFQGMKTVQFIRTQPLTFETDSIVVRDAASIKDAVCHLAKKGHEKIAFLGAHMALSSGRLRQAAFSEAMKENELEVTSELVQTCTPSFELGSDKAALIISGEVNATAVVCGGFEISNGALDACLKAGISLPDDLAFVGYGDPSFYRWIQGGVTTISLPIDALADKALELMLPSPKPSDSDSYAFEANLILRSTT